MTTLAAAARDVLNAADPATKVKAVKNIVFQAKESKTLTSSDEDIDGLMKELLNESIIG